MILTAVASLAATAAAPFATGPAPTFFVDTYGLTITTRTGNVKHVVTGPERFATTPSDKAIPRLVARDGEFRVAATTKLRGVRIKNRFIAEPDGITGPDDLGMALTRFALAEARAGKLTLASDVLQNRPVFRVDIDLPANTCRKLVEGTATLWITKATLLPRRLEVERDGKTQTFVYGYTNFNTSAGALPLFPKLGTRPQVSGQGFLRRDPVTASASLPFVPKLPATLPTGYKLVTSGWAKRGNVTGAGGVNKRDRFLFSAVYVRGWERLEVTQRIANNGTWKKDPFSRTCLAMQAGSTLVNGRGARYGIGPEITSHLWWREGNVLFTVSGPYGKRDLQVIAASMKPVK